MISRGCRLALGVLEVEIRHQRRRSRRLLNFEVLADGVVPGFVMLVGVLGVEKACCGEGLVENGCKLGGGRVSTF